MQKLAIIAFIILSYCSSFAQSCNNWLSTPANSSYFDAGDLDVPGSQITVEAMFNRLTPYVGGPLYAGDVVSKHDGPADVNYLLRPNTAEITTTNGYFVTPPVCEIQLNKTYHIAMTYDGTTLKFYRNGFLLSQTPATGNLFQNNWPLRIGVYLNQFVNTSFIGYIDEVRIWNVVRTQTEIRTYMNTSLPNPTTQVGLLAYYTFDDLTNKQGNATWNGTLGGAAAINATNANCNYCADSCGVAQAPQMNFLGNEICPGGTATLTLSTSGGSIGPGPYTIAYTNGTSNFTQNNVQSGVPFPIIPAPISTTTYTIQNITGTTSSCAAVSVPSVSTTILVNPLPQGAMDGDTVCQGDIGNLRFSITAGTGPFSVTYTDGITNYTTNNINSGSTIPTPYPIQNNTTFTLVSIGDTKTCSRLSNFTKASANIVVRNPAFNKPPDKSTCVKTTVQLSGNNGNTYSYLWSPATYLNDPRSANPLATPDASIQYTVSISEPICNTDSTFVVNLTTNALPTVVAQKSNDIDCSNPTSQLSGTGADSYLWTPSTGLNNPTISNPIAGLTSTTTYILTGTNNFGCKNSDTLTVNVTNAGQPIFVLPNAFTPNGDRYNQCFGIQRWGNVTVHEFAIYNRWGQRVFSTKDPTKCWDGTINGKPQASGAYAYVITASSFCGEVTKKGLVMLIR